MHFPGETERSAQVRMRLDREFDYMSRMFRFWFETDKGKWFRESALPPRSLNLAMALDVQACRQARSIVEECARCEAFGGEAIARALFETVLASSFITQPKVHIVCKLNRKKTGWIAKVPDTSDRKSKANALSHQMRADMYLASFLFQQWAHANKCRAVAGAKRVGRLLSAMIDPKDISNAINSIGPGWTAVIREKGCYSGLNVAELSRLLHRDLFRWYVKMYGPQSSILHGAMAVIHVRESRDGGLGPVYLSDESEVKRILMMVALLFRVFMSEMHRNIGFGGLTEVGVAAFDDEFESVFMQDST